MMWVKKKHVFYAETQWERLVATGTQQLLMGNLENTIAGRTPVKTQALTIQQY
jgi:hypothetical protein